MHLKFFKLFLFTRTHLLSRLIVVIINKKHFLYIINTFTNEYLFFSLQCYTINFVAVFSPFILYYCYCYCQKCLLCTKCIYYLPFERKAYFFVNYFHLKVYDEQKIVKNSFKFCNRHHHHVSF